jgi:hypothetical protein
MVRKAENAVEYRQDGLNPVVINGFSTSSVKENSLLHPHIH